MTGRECSIANALAVVGERWSLLVLREAMFGVRRFDRFAHNTGASRDILAVRLRTLVAAGVLARQQYSTRPPRFEYVLTESGRALSPVLMGLTEWGDRYVTEGEPPTVWEHECGAELHPATVCAECGGSVEETTLRPIRLGRVPT
ncbi:MAG: transcriptional regulator [Actinophytocola sp.]|uniref:winged helix-turn-helix transcriptional regulator n=1 Tax=Actinophytocola sp. TaxID=1872138 RepID=UPI001324D258|nr:helix-turn-helix domain-containing protein [Actinophytocola sp.]MPZ82456.1 transcriptional regulator [Actinophytocola sp.]